MTRDEAIEIRTRQLQGGAVDEGDLQEALRVIQGTHKPYNGRLPAKQNRTPKVQVDMGKRQEPCPCGDDACEADPPAVARALKPWTLITPQTEARVLDPARNAWPLIGSGK